MCTACSLTVSHCIPCMPPLGATTHAPRSNHACPPEQPCLTPLEQPHAPGSNHECPPGATTHDPPWSNHTPPRATMYAPPCEQNDTRFWKYYIAPTSMRAVNIKERRNTKLTCNDRLSAVTWQVRPPSQTSHRASGCYRSSEYINDCRKVQWLALQILYHEYQNYYGGENR